MNPVLFIKRSLTILIALGMLTTAGCDISPIPTPIPGEDEEFSEPTLAGATNAEAGDTEYTDDKNGADVIDSDSLDEGDSEETEPEPEQSGDVYIDLGDDIQ